MFTKYGDPLPSPTSTVTVFPFSPRRFSSDRHRSAGGRSRKKIDSWPTTHATTTLLTKNNFLLIKSTVQTRAVVVRGGSERTSPAQHVRFQRRVWDIAGETRPAESIKITNRSKGIQDALFINYPHVTIDMLTSKKAKKEKKQKTKTKEIKKERRNKATSYGELNIAFENMEVQSAPPPRTSMRLLNMSNTFIEKQEEERKNKRKEKNEKKKKCLRITQCKLELHRHREAVGFDDSLRWTRGITREAVKMTDDRKSN